MFRSEEIRKKEVINIRNAEKLGFIRDIDVCFETGRIKSIIIPGGNIFVKLFAGKSDYVIPWECIVKIGTDIVLIDFSP